MYTDNQNSQILSDTNLLELNKGKISHLHGKLLRKLASEAIESKSVNSNVKADSAFSKSQFSRSNPS